MCGIFGVILGPDGRATLEALHATIKLQFKLSESRGSEAAGWAVRTRQGISVMKRPINGIRMTRSSEYRRLFDEAVLNGSASSNGSHRRNGSLTPPLAVIGHSRMGTNGLQTDNDNNQPVVCGGVVGVHNGIIVNDEALWRRFPAMRRRFGVDTEVLLSLVRQFRADGQPLIDAMCSAFGLIEGAASVALLFEDDLKLVLATNTGSLYVARDAHGRIRIFASEQFILQQLLKDRNARSIADAAAATTIEQLKPGRGFIIDLQSGESSGFDLAAAGRFQPARQTSPCQSPPRPKAPELPPAIRHAIASLRRCSRCVLPETFPFIEFDRDGVCNYCHGYKKMIVKGEDALESLVAPYRSRDGSPDCIVAFSGGRDSSYGLHYLKTVLRMNPVAFTYDWGLITDLARRNQARICGRLGIEHILISADIAAKRANVRRNIRAWLKKPDLGMVPLFMAGDKQFFHYANLLKRRFGVQSMVFAVNPLEKTGFKTGFCGVNESKGGMYFDFSLMKKLRLSAYYLRQYLRNPAYLNSSLLDTAWAFSSSFFISHEYLMLFEYIRWDEEQINSTLRGEYDWELATDTDSTWRIGDGTASFYNYIYYVVAGFTENDTFRSNQIREGAMTREQALRLVDKENQPRWDTIHWYARTIGFDWDEARNVIDAIPKHYL
jgi:glucosamine--fructose-6-phosphate aminotransferase (isomerizing)